MNTTLWMAIPAFVLLMGLEWGVGKRRGQQNYGGKDTAASLSMGLGSLVVGSCIHGAVLALYFLLHAQRLFELGSGWEVWLLTVVVVDFFFYWYHRASHEVRFLWAAHVNHHSSEHLNLSTALRQSWTGPWTRVLFFWPLPLLGFDPLMIMAVGSLSTIAGFWVHTEHIRRLGPLEWLFNTPSHHRVHHGSNPQYLDRNHGNLFILWDRLFGTFEPEGERVRYGLTRNIQTFNPVYIAFHEWAEMIHDVRSAPSLGVALAHVFRSPDWVAKYRAELQGLDLPARVSRVRARGGELASSEGSSAR